MALAPHGITVAAVAPGFVATDMAAPHLAGEAGPAVLYLASPQAEWANGAILDLNGASCLRS